MATDPAPTTVEAPPAPDPTAARCPVDFANVPACPVDHRAMAANGTAVEGLTPADHMMRRLLRIRPTSGDVTEDQAHRVFSTSILISATRCLLSYVVFPIFAPALGAATGVGPAIGIPVGIVALIFDVIAVRRFHASLHRYRWIVTAVYLCIIGLVSFLLVRDIVNLLF